MMEEDNSYKDQRQYPRLSPQVYCRIVKTQTFRQRVSDISMGGARIYSDTRWDIGEEMEMELYFLNGSSGKGKARVVWIKELPPEAGTSYDVGLEFVDLPEPLARELKVVLEESIKK